MANTVTTTVANRQRETVPVSLTAAGAETFFIALEGKYSEVDYLDIEQNITDVKEEPKLKVQLEDSIDEGVKYFATEGVSALTEVTAVSSNIVRVDLSKKPFGPLLRLAFKFGGKGKVVGTITVVTDHA